MKRAVIFGVTGQDGSYLSELLLSKGYEVIGVARRSSTSNTPRINHLLVNTSFTVVQADITDITSIHRVLHEYYPHEIYNLAAQSHVWTSFKQPQLTWNVTGQGCLNILETILTLPESPKFYQASSSEMFGIADGPQNENTRFNPQSPYAIAKLAAHNATTLYRKAYDIFACNGILFNHESERRGESFVTRKITKWIGDLINWEHNTAREYDCKSWRFNINDDTISVPSKRRYMDQIAVPSFPKIKLGNLSARRDWGHAEDYVEAMWLMLQHSEPDDYVVATGKTYSVEEFIIEAFKCINIYGHEDYVKVDKDLYRPSEVPYLCGDSTKAQSVLGWQPTISFQELVRRMVEYDIQSRSKYGETNSVSARSGDSII